jgi:hypothetical protein
MGEKRDQWQSDSIFRMEMVEASFNDIHRTRRLQ